MPSTYVDLNTLHTPANTTSSIPPTSWFVQIRTNDQFFAGKPVVLVRSTAFTHAASTSWSNMSWTEAISDPWDMWTIVHAEKFYARADGQHLVQGFVQWDTNVTGQRGARIRKVSGGSTTTVVDVLVDATPTTATNTQTNVRWVVSMTSTEYCYLQRWQNSGGSRTGTARGSATWISGSTGG